MARVLTRIASLASAIALLIPAAALGADPSYVALGDSYAAGPAIPLQIAPYGCAKSDHNYAHLAAPRLGEPAFRDPPGGGAKTAPRTPKEGAPPGPTPPQFDSLDADTSKVSLTIGGN